MDNKNKGTEQELYLMPETNEASKEEITNTSFEATPLEETPLTVKEEKPIVKSRRVNEIPELRDTNLKVFRMSDGKEQAVFYASDVHSFNEQSNTFENAENIIEKDADGKHYVCGKNRFVARFSREEDNDELFCIEQGMHKVTVFSKKTKKLKNHGVKPKLHKIEKEGAKSTNIISFSDIESGADYEYSVESSGVKENIVVRDNANVYRYPFIIKCQNVTAKFDEAQKRIEFLSNETGEEVFFIPTPFMTDANGVNSTAVSYEVKTVSTGDVHLTVTADSDWINDKNRAFPVIIDPQIKLSASSAMTTYSWDNGYLYSSSTHTVGTVATATSYEATALCDTDDCVGGSSSGSSSSLPSGMSSAVKLSFNTAKSGSIDCPCDEVWYKFTANASAAHINGGNGTYTIYSTGSYDSMGYLYNSNGGLITSNDDSGDGYNFKITASLTYGKTYYIKVKGYGSKTGSYKLYLSYTTATTSNPDCDDCDDGSQGAGTSTPCYTSNRMYMRFNMPTLPRNPRIKKAELKLYQASGVSESVATSRLGLYHVTDNIATGFCTPLNDSNLIDYAVMKTGHCDEGSVISYTFDITSLVDMVNKNETYYPQLVLKMSDENADYNNNVQLYGSSYGGSFAPQIVYTYESSYGVNTSYRTHTHELGRFGQGSVDLQCGNLMFESEDFAWNGNRMPVTIKHLYNSALSAYQYTYNSGIKLQTADFSAMKIGYGFKLNIMQSIRYTTFQHNGELYGGYVYIGENGEETYFKQSEKQEQCDSGTQCYNLFEDIESGELLYDPYKYILTQGDETYQFDYSGKLVSITDKYGNKMRITYTSGRITSVTDGADRDFTFAYNSSGYLTSITAPDNTSILYSYSGSYLYSVTYPNGAKAYINYSSGKPTEVILKDSGGCSIYKVAYAYSSNRLTSVTEYGVKNNSFVTGNSSTYSYSAASGRTIVTTTEQMDAEMGDCYNNAIKTVYTFDDDGNVISDYAYTEDTGNTGVEGGESGINPYLGDGGVGVVSNIDNLLLGHDFNGLSDWYQTDCNCGDFTAYTVNNESDAKFGRTYLFMRSYNSGCVANGVYQVTNALPIGQYTFSAYLQVVSAFTGATDAGAYIRVSTTGGKVLVESEHISAKDAEYIRLIAPFELKTAQSVKVEILFNGVGTVYVNAPQLEKNPYANAYNMLENGNFENNLVSWGRPISNYTTETSFNMSRSYKISGDINNANYCVQVIHPKADRSTRETFTLSGWAKGYGLPNHERDEARTPTFRLRARISCYDSDKCEISTEEYVADFSPSTEEWQFASIQFSKSKCCIIEHIKVYCDYDYNIGTAYFDNIQLVRDSIETGLTASDFEVDDATEDTTNTTETTETTETEQTTEFEELLDAFGNTLTETTFTDGEFGTIYRSFGFNTDSADMLGDNSGNDLVSETDARGNVTEYTVDEDTSRNEEVTDRCGNKTAYEYDASGRTTKVTSKKADGTEISNVSYSYDEFDNMTEIVRGDGMKYALKYNANHNLESIGIDGKAESLVKYTYKNGNGRLKQITYANGDCMKASYNTAGQMTAEKWYNKNGSLTAYYKYVYDGQGNLVRSIDIKAKKEYNYLYENGKIYRSTESDIVLNSDEIVIKKSLVCTVQYSYDAEDNLTKKRIIWADGKENVINYTSVENSDTIVKFVAEGNNITSHSKTDSFGRKVFDELQLDTGFVSRQFSYYTGEATEEHIENKKLKSTPTTQLVSQIVLSGGRTLSYEYDKEERITKVIDSFEGTTEYTYDALGQLIKEVVNGKVINEMTYDNYGNILTKDDERYTYAHTSAWKDLLVKVGNETIEYDAQGNPTEYLGHTLTWEKGRQLKSFDDITYTYNANGIRTSKTVNGVKYTYVLDGTKILRETWGSNVMDTLYDNEDNVCGIVYNGDAYYFLKNLQGDVIAITDSTGETVAEYTYDAWGKLLSVSGDNISIASINPYRYRGYYFDSQTNLYYLQSRYYDSNIGRFINGDDIENALYTERILDQNIFTYVQNNPVVLSDSTGESWITDVWKNIKKGASSAWNWMKKACSNVGNYFKNTVWKKWVVNTVWQTFCKKWVWEKFCKKMVYETFLKKWVWQTFCKKWTWQTFCKKWVWQTFCKKWVWQTFFKDWIANKAWSWLKKNWKRVVDGVSVFGGGASIVIDILSEVGLVSVSGPLSIVLLIFAVLCFVWDALRYFGII